jgi:tetratricopeptide (TPR) repeat protein
MSIRGRTGLLWQGGLIVLLVFLAYLPALRGGFVSDDDLYVTNDPLLTAPDGLKRIWFSMDSPSQYFPLAYTTFRIERTLWGLNPAGYHWVNLLLHAANALLVWKLLKRLSVPGAWLAAALFALHPVEVESVAWIAECKNVLMCFFFLLALLAWIEFVEDRPKPLWRYYLLALLFCGLALCSKTTACTLPAALLLTLWLQRKPINRQRLMQIAPFLLMGAGLGLVTVWWERHHQGAQGNLFSMDLLERVLVASHAVWFYAGKLVWPVNLTFSYPRWTINPAEPLAYGWLVAGTGLGVVIYFARRFVGRGVEVAALFYVATLSPLLGFIMLYTFRYTFVADHYQYVASIGPLALAAAGITIAFKTKPFLKLGGCGALLLTLGILTWRQAGMYTDTETLWRTTIARNPDCGRAYGNLGIVLADKGQFDEAIKYFRKALQINPDYPETLNNLGLALAAKGRLDEAVENYRKAIQINPNDADTLNNLGLALAAKGQFGEAIGNFYKAIQINPSYTDALNNLGNALAVKGRLDEAIENYRKAIQLNPNSFKTLDNLGIALTVRGQFNEAIGNYCQAIQLNSNRPEIFFHLGMTLGQLGRTREAVAQYREALRLNPNLAGALNNLAWVLAASPDDGLRDGAEAVRLAERACELTHYGEPLFIGTLAAAYAEAGRFPEAVATAEKAEQLAAAAGLAAVAAKNRQLRELYRAGKPYHESLPAAASSLQTPAPRPER